MILFLSLADILAEVFSLRNTAARAQTWQLFTLAAAIENRRQTGKDLDYLYRRK